MKKYHPKIKYIPPLISSETKDQIKMLKARGIPMSQIAKSVGLEEADIDYVIGTLLTDVEDTCLTEMMSAIDGYSTMILDFTSLISSLKDTKDPAERRELSDYMKQRADLQVRKIDLITKAFNMRLKINVNPGQQTGIEGYIDRIENTKPEQQVPTSTMASINTNNPIETNITPKKTHKIFCYKILGILTGMDFTRKMIKRYGTDKKTIKTIVRAVGCTNEEVRIVINRMLKNKFPKPTNKTDKKLKSLWKKKIINNNST